MYAIFTLIIGIIILGVFIFTHPMECIRTERTKTLIQAVGHKYTTSYLYELENGGRFESNELVRDGQAICVEEGIR